MTLKVVDVFNCGICFQKRTKHRSCNSEGATEHYLAHIDSEKEGEEEMLEAEFARLLFFIDSCESIKLVKV